MPRYRLDAEIRVDDQAARTIDISAQSVLFEIARHVNPGDRVAMVFPFEYARPGSSVRCTGEVVRVERRGEDRFAVAAIYEPIAFSVTG